MLYKSVTGTRDVLPDEQPYWRFIENKISEITSLFGYVRVDPPILEETRLFIRGVGETTDIVEKEMYSFIDKGENAVTMRPEFTAGVLRLYLQNGMHKLSKPVKLYSIGPIFRYEKPQAGRFRQHTQFNVEALGEQNPALDMEVMSIAWQLYSEFGFSDLTFQLNSTGCPNCRPDYIEKLNKYYSNHLSEICDDCKRRLERNALRLLDCKKEQCQITIENAPVISNHLCSECSDHFSQLCHYLKLTNRAFQINHKLVRGLDYYTKTVFEIWAKGIGAQNAMCGGGRYDGLIEQLGGPPTPGIGFGSGIERIIQNMIEQNISPAPLFKPQVYIAHFTPEAQIAAVSLTSKLREGKVGTLMSFGGKSMKAALRDANRQGVDFVIIIGQDEVENQFVTIKNLNDSSQEQITINNVVTYLKDKLGI